MPQSHRTGLYIFSLQRQDSAVAGKNFLTVENPAGSTKIISLGGFFVSYFATVAAPAYPMRGYRATSSPTGGTQATVPAICKFDTAITDPIAVVRYNDPTCTTDGAFFNSPSGTVKDTVGGVHEIDAPAGFNPFILRPGEAVVLRQDVGAVGMLWNVSVLWRETGLV